MKYNDYELIYMIRENDLDKEIIFKKYKPIVERYAEKYYRSIEYSSIDKEDLIQEGYIALNKAIDSYNEDSSLFYTFACLCIERHIYNCIKKITKSKSIYNNTYSYNDDSEGINYLEVLESNSFSPIIGILDDSYQNNIIEIKNSLNDIESAIFELRYNGFAVKEIATLLDISIYNVRSVINRIKKNTMFKGLKELLKESY